MSKLHICIELILWGLGLVKISNVSDKFRMIE